MQTEKKPISISYNLGDLISYRNGVMYIKIELVELRIKRQRVIISFNILLLGKEKTVLEMP